MSYARPTYFRRLRDRDTSIEARNMECTYIWLHMYPTDVVIINNDLLVSYYDIYGTTVKVQKRLKLPVNKGRRRQYNAPARLLFSCPWSNIFDTCSTDTDFVGACRWCICFLRDTHKTNSSSRCVWRTLCTPRSYMDVHIRNYDELTIYEWKIRKTRTLPVHSVMFSTGAIAAYGAQMLRTAERMVGRVIRRVLYIARIIHHTVPVDAV